MDYRMPLYLQLKEMIIQRIEDKQYLPGERLPSEREMAKTYQINRMTVKNAINSLVEDGYLYKVKNKGTFVVKKDDDKKIYFDSQLSSPNYGLSAIFKKAGFSIENEIVDKGIISGKRFLEDKLKLNEGEDIFYIHRLRSVEGSSVALEHTYVPLKFFPDINNYNFSQVSLYDYMELKNHLPVETKETMTVQKVKHPIERIMKIDADDFLFVYEFTGYDSGNEVVEYTTSYTRCDKAFCSYKIEQN
ncbi:HTH-type transcriptional repressor YvoA [Lachnospiraceae bacterium]|nr:HTH-type transcriptional repressor YvoA [Lachnospiraceae bacterium]